MEETSSNFWGGPGAWKLRTLGDYLFFGLIIVLGIVAMKVAIKIMRRNRRPEVAIARTANRLVRIGGKGSFCVRSGVMQTGKGEREFDLIWYARDAVRAVKVYHFGLEVTGDIESDEWSFSDRAERMKLPNPMPDLTLIRNAMGRAMVSAGVANAKADTLVVFADNFGTTRNAVSGLQSGVSLTLLRRWRRANPIDKKKMLDIEAARECIEPMISQKNSL